jgi:3-deoxy-D-manno-octulosonic-acid transferase
MIIAYRILTTLLYPLLFMFLYFRKVIKKEDPERFKEKILISHFNVKKKYGSMLIWFHAASVGEFKSIIPIIKQLNINNQNVKFLITTTTLSSGNLAKIELTKFNNVEHRYFPFDINFLIDKFLHLWAPDKIILVDSEIWPNLILKAKQLKIPIALINARLTSKSFKRWMIFPNIAKKIFGKFSLFICSNAETKKFLEKLDLKNIFFKGNIKLIDHIDEKNIKNINRDFLLNKRFWFAASIHKDEDIFCLKTHIEIKKKFRDIITIIAPRHIERAKKINSLSKKFNLEVQILNKEESILDNKEIIIINYFGVLQNYFKYAKSVFIGKSSIKKFKNDGGQNPIEAAKLKCKIYHGPYVYNFDDIYKILEQKNISKKIENYKELSKYLISDLTIPNKQKNQISNPIEELEQKTLKDTMLLINDFLYNENK